MNSFVIAILLLWGIQSHSIVSLFSQPHNSDCYTQGLFFLNETHLFETCGLYNKSYFHLLEYQSTPFEIRNSYSTSIPWRPDIFLEGAVLFKGFIYMMTWREHIVYKLSPDTFEVQEELKWRRQGWGLTENGTHMFATDGSDKIYLVNEKFEVVDQKSIVTELGRKQYNINELEYVDGYIYANIYYSSKIVKIDYQKAKVVLEFDGANLVKSETGLASDEVFNGIAYDKKDDKFILTGKHWKKFHQVTL